MSSSSFNTFFYQYLLANVVALLWLSVLSSCHFSSSTAAFIGVYLTYANLEPFFFCKMPPMQPSSSHWCNYPLATRAVFQPPSDTNNCRSLLSHTFQFTSSPIHFTSNLVVVSYTFLHSNSRHLQGSTKGILVYYHIYANHAFVEHCGLLWFCITTGYCDFRVTILGLMYCHTYLHWLLCNIKFKIEKM